jgi:hypothetical protein
LKELPIGIARMFKEPHIVKDKRYARLTINNIENIIEFIDKYVKILPFESTIALQKLYNGDIKSFIDTYVDAYLCTPLISLCRERGPRIKCSIYSDSEYIEVYSECFDIELLFSIIFGDLSNLFIFETGYRDGIRFKRSIISRNLIEISIPEVMRRNKSKSKEHLFTIPLKTFSNVFEYILKNADEVTELILHIPCLDNKVIELLYRIARVLSNKSRIYVLTTLPTSEIARRCISNYKNMLISYIEASEFLPRYNITLCNADIVHIGLIINRFHYIVSYEYSYSDNVEVSMVKDKSYIETISLSYLRECLCSANLVKDDLNKSTSIKV